MLAKILSALSSAVSKVSAGLSWLASLPSYLPLAAGIFIGYLCHPFIKIAIGAVRLLLKL